MKKKSILSGKSPSRIFTLIVVCFIVFASFSRGQAQDYTNLIDTTKTWNVLHLGHVAWGIAAGHTETYQFSDETIEIEGQMWNEIMHSFDSIPVSWSGADYMREDTISKKVYVFVGEEELRYDFSLEVGDTAYITNYSVGVDNAALVCDSVAYVTISNQQYKKLWLREAGEDHLCETWIEGIGSQFGILESGVGTQSPGGALQLICYKENDELVYQDAVFTDCYYDDFYPKITTDSFDTAYLGLPYSMQIPISDTSGIDSLRWIHYGMPDGFDLDEATGVLYGTPTDTTNMGCTIILINEDLHLLTDIIQGYIPVMPYTGIADQSNKTACKIYPNPAESHFTIEYSASPASFILTDLSGREVLRRQMQTGTEKIPTDDLEAGIYFIRFSSESNQLVKKLLIR